MKYLLLAIFIIGCNRPVSKDREEVIGQISEVCIGGVVYYQKISGFGQGRSDMMAVAVDKETLKPIRCKYENR